METLTALDRCDRCGAQAYVITLHARGELLWCGHHYEKNKNALVDGADAFGRAIRVVDHRGHLVP